MTQRGATLLAATLLLCACEAAPVATPTPPPQPATDGMAAFVGSPSLSSNEQKIERSIQILRRALRRRGLGPEVVTGPMIVVPTPEHPDAEPAVEGPEAGELVATWPSGAALVVTAGGRWWVWEYGSTAPADAMARQLSAGVGTRGQ